MTARLEEQATRLAIDTPFRRSTIRALQDRLMDSDGIGRRLSEEQALRAVPGLLDNLAAGFPVDVDALRIAMDERPAASASWLTELRIRLNPSFWRRIATAWCFLTDHVYIDPPGAPEPFCRRCGCSAYWPVRRTMGRFAEDALAWIARRLRRGDEMPF